MCITKLHLPSYLAKLLNQIGKLFLICFIWLGPFEGNYKLLAADDIFLPPSPSPLAPPPPSKSRDRDFFRNLKKNREKKNEPKKPPLEDLYSYEKDKELLKFIENKKSYHFMAQISLLLPFVTTSGQRKNFSTELTSHMNVLFHIPQIRLEKKTPIWGGLRVAPFSGVGQYAETVGRYSFLYFGPSIAYGGLIPDISDPLKKKMSPAKESKQVVFPVKSAWFLSMGFSGQTRIANIDPSSDVVDKDLNTFQGAQLDGSGFWMELTYAKIYFGGLGVHYVSGLQLAEEKLFIWLGFAAGGWY